jgi:hypothetical protein
MFTFGPKGRKRRFKGGMVEISITSTRLCCSDIWKAQGPIQSKSFWTVMTSYQDSPGLVQVVIISGGGGRSLSFF